jgi:hypothetical protein
LKASCLSTHTQGLRWPLWSCCRSPGSKILLTLEIGSTHTGVSCLSLVLLPAPTCSKFSLIILGRNQNPWVEVNLGLWEELKTLRRMRLSAGMVERLREGRWLNVTNLWAELDRSAAAINSTSPQTRWSLLSCSLC